MDVEGMGLGKGTPDSARERRKRGAPLRSIVRSGPLDLFKSRNHSDRGTPPMMAAVAASQSRKI